jgi:hypothetical protein
MWNWLRCLFGLHDMWVVYEEDGGTHARCTHCGKIMRFE